MVIYRSIRYRVYPTPEQAARLERWQRALATLWNVAHEQRLMGLARHRVVGCRTDKNGEERGYTAGVDERVFVNYLRQQSELTEMRAQFPWLRDVPCSACQGTLRSLDMAWNKAFQRVAGRPHFKRVNTCAARPALVAPATTKVFGRGTIQFPRIGHMRAVIHQRPSGKHKTLSLVRDVNQWFIVVMFEIHVPDPAPHRGPAVGIDRGVVNVIADSSGRIVQNPQFSERMQPRIAREQRNLARKLEAAKRDGRDLNGANIRKAREKLALLHRKVRRQRDHFLQSESRRYADTYGTIYVEKLHVEQMSKSARGTREQPGANVRAKAGLNRSIMGAGWGKFVSLARIKAEERGGAVVDVPAKNSSVTCSSCGAASVESRRSQSVFCCTECGHCEHADVNAAKVIRARGLNGRIVMPKQGKTLRVPYRRKSRATETTVVQTVEACGGDRQSMRPSDAGRDPREGSVSYGPYIGKTVEFLSTGTGP